MAHEINLDGGETTIIKALGTGGAEVSGETLIDRTPSMVPMELIEILKSLIMQGYVEADRRSFHSEDDLKATNFNVNSGYARDLREALDPRTEKKSRRVRRE